MLRLDLIQAVGHVLQRRPPIDLFPGTPLLEHGLGQALLAIQRLIGETVAISDPALVDGLVLERHDAHHPIALDLHDQVGAGRIVRADALAARQLPGAGAVAERLAGQCADRADVDHVSRQLGIH